MPSKVAVTTEKGQGHSGHGHTHDNNDGPPNNHHHHQVPRGEGLKGAKLLNELLRTNKDYPDLTSEFDRTGEVAYLFQNKEIGRSQEEEDVAKRLMKHQRLIKTEAEAKADAFCKDHEVMVSSVPEVIGNMNIECLIATIESQNGKVTSFEDILKHLIHFKAEDLLKATQSNAHIKKLRKDKGSAYDGDKDMFSTEDEAEAPNETGSIPRKDALPKTPELTMKAGAAEVPPPTTVKRVIEFPSARKMIASAKKVMTPPPSSEVFQFGENQAPLTRTAKAPRICKPGEVAFSIRGSPILLPKVPVRSETIPVLDEDGKRIAEVILCPGEQDKRKEFLSIATDIRGIVASRTLKQPHRVQPSRVARKATAASAKKPDWRS